MHFLFCQLTVKLVDRGGVEPPGPREPFYRRPNAPYVLSIIELVRVAGFEPALVQLLRLGLCHLGYTRMKWYRRTDSNRHWIVPKTIVSCHLDYAGVLVSSIRFERTLVSTSS